MAEEKILEQILVSLQGLEKRFDAVDNRFDAVDKRFDGVDNRFDSIDKRLDTIDKKVDTLQTDFRKLDREMAEYRRDIRADVTEIKDRLSNTTIKVKSLEYITQGIMKNQEGL